MSAENNNILRKVPPQNVQAERSVLGAILIKNELIDEVAEFLAGDDFYRESHRVIWSAMIDLAAAKRSIDAVTIADALTKPVLEQVGGGGYIAELAECAIPTGARDHARIVREKSIQRQVLSYATELAGTFSEPPEQWAPDWTEEQLATAEHDIAAIVAHTDIKPEPSKAETLKTIIWRLQHGFEDAVPTGFASLDRVFGGFSVGHLTILGARTSRGKTSFALNVATNAANAGFAVAYFTLEQPAPEMYERALGCVAGADMFRARRCHGFRDDGEKERVLRAQHTLETLPFEILYRPSMRPRQLRLECRRLMRMGSLKLVIIDYLGLMRGNQHERERWRELQEVVFALKALAGELGLPLLVLSQLNREATDENLSLAHLRDTGASEEHSSNVLLIRQKSARTDTVALAQEWEDVEIYIAKQRNGPADVHVPLHFNKRHGVFAAT